MIASRCKRNHPLTPKNTRLEERGLRTIRRCRRCDADRQFARYWQRKATERGAIITRARFVDGSGYVYFPGSASL